MKQLEHHYDFVVAGGGISGVAAAVTASRCGLKTALVQDRPVLGGVGSKEIQVPMVGAFTIDANVVYGRETGLMEELLLENLYRNPTRTPEYWDLTLTDLVKKEANLDLFFNTTVNEVGTDAAGTRIDYVKAYTFNAETWHTFHAPLFSDCTGDATVGYLAGAPYRIGCESRDEFGESLAPERKVETGMGCSLQFRAKDAGVPVPFRKPEWVQFTFNEDDFGPYRPIQSFRRDHGGYWWIEWGALYDTVHDTNRIKDELLQVVYAIWDFLKNRSTIRDDLQTFVLDWVGMVPGKRESRRLEGEHMLTQGDIDRNRHFEDAVAYGGWGFDDHPSTGIFGDKPTTFHVFHKAPYNVPLRSLFSRQVENLFFAGRNISASHVALSTTRVMLTCGQLGEAVGAAASICRRDGCMPKQLLPSGRLPELQRMLQRWDHTIAGLPYSDTDNVARSARVTASSELVLAEWGKSAGSLPLSVDRLQMFPVVSDRIEHVSVLLDVQEPAELAYSIYSGPDNGSNYPERQLASGNVRLNAGERQWVQLPVQQPVARSGWHFVVLKKHPHIAVHYAYGAPVGMKTMERLPEHEIHRNRDWNFNRSLGQAYRSLLFCIAPEQPAYRAANAIGEWERPNRLPELWISQPTSFVQPEWLELQWEEPQPVNEVHLLFDSSLDISLYPIAYAGTGVEADARNTVPSIVKDYRLLARMSDADRWEVIREVSGNYLRHNVHRFAGVTATRLRVEVLATNGLNRAHICSIRVLQHVY